MEIYLLLFQAVGMVRGKDSIFNFNNGIFDHAISTCGVAPLWFLLALFIAEILAIWIKPVLKKWGGCCGVLIILGLLAIATSFWYDSLTDINLVLCNYLTGFFRIFPTTFFVVLGYGIKDKIKQCAEWALWLRITMLFTLLGLQAIMCFFWDEGIDVRVFRLGTQWIYFPKAIVGTLVVLLLSQIIHAKWLVFLGGKTKELMILHYLPFYWTVALRFFLGKIFRPNIIGGLIITAVTIVGCLVIDWMVCRFKVWKFVMRK